MERDNFLEWLVNEIIDIILDEYFNGVPVEEIAEEWEIPLEVVQEIILSKCGGSPPH